MNNVTPMAAREVKTINRNFGDCEKDRRYDSTFYYVSGKIPGGRT